MVLLYENMKYQETTRFWSNHAGMLMAGNTNEPIASDKLPANLKRAWTELYTEDTGADCYLAEHDGEACIALVNEFCPEYGRNHGMDMVQLYHHVVEQANKLDKMEDLSGCRILAVKNNGFGDSHELVTCIPASVTKEHFVRVAKALYDNVYSAVA